MTDYNDELTFDDLDEDNLLSEELIEFLEEAQLEYSEEPLYEDYDDGE